MQIGIVGHGVVGQHLERLFRYGGMMPLIYDEFPSKPNAYCSREAINSCDLVFVAVPTPAGPMGECDISAVEAVVRWIDRPMCLKSSVVPGTTDRLAAITGKELVFSPEYVGETPFHESRKSMEPDLVVVGGPALTCDAFLDIYRSVFGPGPRYFRTDAITAELAKYMENCFFATKVTFVAQFYLLATLFGVDFTLLREIWVADTRVGRSHSTVVGSLGFDGRCLPKDLSAIIAAARSRGVQPMFLESVQNFNNTLRNSCED